MENPHPHAIGQRVLHINWFLISLSSSRGRERLGSLKMIAFVKKSVKLSFAITVGKKNT